MMELILIAQVWQKATEVTKDPARVQKRMKDAPVHVQKSKQSPPTIQSWYAIFKEDFESVTPPALPSGWTANDGNGDGYTWQTYGANQNCTTWPITFSSQFACYDDDAVGPSSPATVEKLTTPQITILSGGSSYRVRFDYDYEEVTGDPVETLYVNLVNITQNTTTRIFQRYGADDVGSASIDISGLVNGGDVIQLEFVYNDAGDWGWGIGIDNVVVEGDYTFSNDLATTDIKVNLTSGPQYYFYPPGTMINIVGDVWVKFTNTGSNTLSGFNLYLKVNNMTYGPVGYPGTLGSNQTDSVKFPNINFNMGSNNLKAWHNLSDQFYLNDTLRILYSSPIYKADTVLNYPMNFTTNISIGAGGNLGYGHQAVRYDSSKVWPLVISQDSYYITKVFFFHCYQNADPNYCSAGITRVSLWKDDGMGRPDLNGEIISRDTFLQAPPSGAALYFVKLPQVIKLSKSILPFYAGRSWIVAAQYPFAVDENSKCVPGYSCWIRADNYNGGDWIELYLINPSLDYSWILGIVVQAKSSGYEEVILPNDARLFKSEFVKNGKLEFNKPLDKELRIQFYNTNGSIVRDLKLSKGTKVINIGKLPSGTYIYVADNKVGKLIVK